MQREDTSLRDIWRCLRVIPQPYNTVTHTDFKMRAKRDESLTAGSALIHLLVVEPQSRYFNLAWIMRLFLGVQKLSLHFSLHCVSALLMVVQRKTFWVPDTSLHLINTRMSQAPPPASAGYYWSRERLMTWILKQEFFKACSCGAFTVSAFHLHCLKAQCFFLKQREEWR